MSNNEMPHEGHDQHLCALHEEGLLKDNFEEWKRLVSNGQFVCGGCGRVANVNGLLKVSHFRSLGLSHTHFNY